jgi:hypothetical protein
MEVRRVYGLSSGLFVAPKASTQSIVVGGMGEDTAKWTRVLSQRAAHILWFHLATLLFPEKSASVTAGVLTTPSRGLELPTITHHITVDKLENSLFEITGWVGASTWTAQLTHVEAQRLWQALDVTLYPQGWHNSAPK